MSVKVNLPTGYQPFEKLVICSNTLENGLVPVSISGDIPFLIGKGNQPKVWVNLLSTNEIGNTDPLVISNSSVHPQIVVDECENEVSVTVNGNVLLRVQKVSEREAIVTELDLRNVGVEIYGDSEKLVVVQQTLSKNKFKNVDCMIGINMN